MALIYQGENATHIFRGTAPTTRADGTDLASNEISHYIRFVEAPNGDVEQMDVLLVDGAFNEEVSADAVAVGVYTYWYRTVDTGGRQSADSITVQLDVRAPLAPPNPPAVIG